MLLPYLLQNLGAASPVNVSSRDAAVGSESISVQHDLSALFPVGTGSGQRNFGSDKRKAIEQPAQPRYSDVMPPLVFPAQAATATLQGSQDKAQAADAAAVSVSGGWADSAIAVDGVALSISAEIAEQARGLSAASIEASADVADTARGAGTVSIRRQLSAHVVQAQGLYVMGFFD